MVFSEGDKAIFVLPPKTDKFKIGELTIKENGSRYNFSYTFKSAMGNVTILNYDKSFQYDLPFQKGKTYNVFQGYNGSFSHQDENAIDFSMQEGSEVLAAREGIIVQIVQNNTESCPAKECEKYNNYITIMHADGTFASYVHIKYNSAKFNIGDAVKKGDIIASSGNVGRSNGPHLHFVCFLGAFGKRNTLETKFKIDKGDKVALVEEGKNYLRDY
jgi:murein DD-endopeptidase MepM/ murein hydrolase activator NlpD